MSPFDHDGWAEQAVAYALHAMEPSEESAFAAHLAGCAQCRRTVERTADTAADMALALDPVEPPDSLRASIMAAVARTPQAQTSPPAPVVPPVRVPPGDSAPAVVPLRRPAPRSRMLVAAGLVLAVAGAAVGLAATRGRPAGQPDAVAKAFVGCLDDKTCHEVRLYDPQGNVAAAVLLRQGSAELVNQRLRPNAASSTTYVLWAQRRSGQVAAVGAFDVRGASMSVQRMTWSASDTTALMVTLEAGRVPPRTGSSPVAQGTVGA